MSERKAEKEAKKQAFRFEEAVKAGLVVDDSIKFQEFSKKFIEEYAKPQLKQKTWVEYENKLKIINKGIGHIKLKDLRAVHLTSFYNNLYEDGMNRKTGGKLSAKTIHDYHRVISSVLGKAVKWQYIPFSPAINAERPRLEPKEAAFLDEQEARRLLELLHFEPI